MREFIFAACRNGNKRVDHEQFSWSIEVGVYIFKFVCRPASVTPPLELGPTAMQPHDPRSVVASSAPTRIDSVFGQDLNGSVAAAWASLLIRFLQLCIIFRTSLLIHRIGNC